MNDKKLQVSRVKRSKQDAQAAYDRMSGWYDLLTAPFESRYRDQGLNKMAPAPGERLLEIGPGTGHALVEMAKSVGVSGHILGLDLSVGMLNRCQGRLLEDGLAPRVWLQQGDGAHLPYRAQSLDGVFISFTLELFDTPEISQVVRECRRALKTGGRLVVVAMDKQPNPNLITRLYEWLHRQIPQYADCRPIWVQTALEANGFQIVERGDFSMMGLPGVIVLARC